MEKGSKKMNEKFCKKCGGRVVNQTIQSGYDENTGRPIERKFHVCEKLSKANIEEVPVGYSWLGNNYYFDHYLVEVW